MQIHVIHISVCNFLSRHRVVNLFLQGYNKTWISTEDRSFEEKLVEDLAINAKVSRIYIRSLNYFRNKNICLWGKIHCKKKKITESSLKKNLLPPGGLISVVFTDLWSVNSSIDVNSQLNAKVLHSNISSLFQAQIILFLLCTSTCWTMQMFLWTVSKLKWVSLSSWTADECTDGVVWGWERRTKWQRRRYQSDRSSPPAHYTLRSNCSDGKQVCLCAFLLVFSLWKGQSCKNLFLLIIGRTHLKLIFFHSC